MGVLARLTLRERIWPLLAVFFGAPVCAEYLQAYLPGTGDGLGMLAGLLIFGPLYGGAALLIREIAVRTGRGWRGIVLLATAFGVAMPGLVDLSLFAEDNPGVAYWDQLRLPTLLDPLGIAVYPTIVWVLGHVLMSVGAPLALLDGLAPRHRQRPLLGGVGLAMVATLWLAVTVFVRSDAAENEPSFAQTASACVCVAALGVLAFTPVGRPVAATTAGQRISPWKVLVAGFVGMLVIDLAPPTWPGVGLVVCVVLTAAVVLGATIRNRRWTAYEIALLAAGALIGRTLTGFLAPLPEGVSAVAKYSSSTVLLAVVTLIAAVVVRSGHRVGPTTEVLRP